MVFLDQRRTRESSNEAIAQHFGGKSLGLHRRCAKVLKVSLNRRQKLGIDTGKFLQVTAPATLKA